MPTIRIESLRLLSWSMKKYRLIPTKSELSTLLSFSDPSLHSLTADGVGEVRDMACEVFGALLLRCGNNNHILQKTMEAIGDKLKISKIQAFDKEFSSTENSKASPVSNCATANLAQKAPKQQPMKQLGTAPQSTSQSKMVQSKAPSTSSSKPMKIETSTTCKGGFEYDKNGITLPESLLSESAAKDMIGAVVPKLVTPSNNWKERQTIIEEASSSICALINTKEITLESLMMVSSLSISSESIVAVILAQLNMLDDVITSVKLNPLSFSSDAQRSLSILLSISMKCLGDSKTAIPFSKLILSVESVATSRQGCGKITEALLCSIIRTLGKATAFPKATLAAFSLCSSLVPRICSESSPLDPVCLDLVKGWIVSQTSSPQLTLRNAALSFASLILSHHNLVSHGYVALGLSKPPETSTCCKHPCVRASVMVHTSSTTPSLVADASSSITTNVSSMTVNMMPQTAHTTDSAVTNMGLSTPPCMVVINPSTMTALSSSAWKERKAALDVLSTQFSSLEKITISGTTSHTDLISQLGRRFEDSNKNIAAQALEIFRCLILRIHLNFSECFRALSGVLPPLINSLSDLKSTNRLAAHAALSALAEFAGEGHIAALISEILGRMDTHPQTKKEILLWLNNNLFTTSNPSPFEDATGACPSTAVNLKTAYSLELATALAGVGSTSKFFLGSLLPGTLQDRLPECRRAAFSILNKLVLILGTDTLKASILQHCPKGSPLLPIISNPISGPALGSMDVSTNIPQFSSAITSRMTPLKGTRLNSPIRVTPTQPDFSTNSERNTANSLDTILKSPSSKILTMSQSSMVTQTNMLFTSMQTPTLPSPPFLSDLSNSMLIQRLVSAHRVSSQNEECFATIESLRNQRTRDMVLQADIVALLGGQPIPKHAQNSISPQWRTADSLLELGVFCPSWVRSLLLSEEKVLLTGLEALRAAISAHPLSMAIFAVLAEPLLRAVVMCVIGRDGTIEVLSVKKSAEMPLKPPMSSSAVVLAALETIEELSNALESHNGRLAASEATHLALFLISLSTLDPREAIRQRARRFFIDGFLRIYPASKLLNPLLIDLVEAASAGMIMQESQKESHHHVDLLALALPLAASVRARSELADLTATVTQRVGSVLLASSSSQDVEPKSTMSLGSKVEPISRLESKPDMVICLSELSQKVVNVISLALACNESDPLVRRSLIGILSALASAIPISQLGKILEEKFTECLSFGRTIIGGDANIELAQIMEKISASSLRRTAPSSPRPLLLHEAVLNSPLVQTKRAASVIGGSPLSAHLRQRKKDLLAGSDARVDDEETLPASLADLSMDNIAIDPEAMLVMANNHEQANTDASHHMENFHSTSTSVQFNDIEPLLQQISSPESNIALEAIGTLSLRLPSSSSETGTCSDAIACSLFIPHVQMLCMVLCQRIKGALLCKLSVEEGRVAEDGLGALLAMALNASLLEAVKRPGIEALFDLLLSTGLVQVVTDTNGSSATLSLIANLVLKAVISNAHPGHVMGVLIELCSIATATPSANDISSEKILGRLSSSSPFSSWSRETVLQCLWRASKNFEIFLGKGDASAYPHQEAISEILSACLCFIGKNPISHWNTYVGIDETTVRSIKTILQQIARWIVCSNISLDAILPSSRDGPNTEQEAIESIRLWLSHFSGAIKSAILSGDSGTNSSLEINNAGLLASRHNGIDIINRTTETTIDEYRSRLSQYTNEFYRLSNRDEHANDGALRPVESPVSEVKKATLLASSNLSTQILSIKERLAKIRDSH